ncbi:MAG TPA: BBP7 family outer membrane beta-barrel protein, partial [Dongiaceae bacterium]|nr:BBP7 family outer membrane beta-barrel protein [Dongiaceae bacterium]
MKGTFVAGLAWLLTTTSIAAAQTPGAASITREAGPFSVSAEALVLWFKSASAPAPLVSTGLVGEPGTKVLLGGEDLDTNPNPGMRLSASYAPAGPWGVDTSVFYIPTRSTSRSVGSSGQPGSTDIFFPFIDPFIPGESVSNLSSAGLYSGHAVERFSTSLLGAELNGTFRVAAGAAWRLDALGGFRYLRLRETYVFETDSPFIPPQPADVYHTRDQFDATNNFFGGQLGLRARGDWGAWFVNGVAKVALGAMAQTVGIEG